MRINRGLLLGLLACMVAGLVPRVIAPKAVSAGSERALLSGAIRSASGQKMSGVTVSAKAEAQTITTSVTAVPKRKKKKLQRARLWL